jgi:predicted MPP superfamily phosphohydrolase
VTRRRRLLLSLAATLLLPLIWAFGIEPARLRNESYEIAIPRWPAACDGIRVAVLADLHVGSPFNGLEKLRRIRELTERARPDMVLLAGDFVIHGVVGGQFTSPELIAAELRSFTAPLGVWAVLGNHDWWFDAPRVRRSLESVRIPVLEDAAIPVGRASCHFWLAGISDYWEGRHDIARALAPVPASAPVIAFTHNPDIFPGIPPRVGLTIAGHTHGGQVYVPLIGRPIVPSRYGQRYAFGHIVEGNRHLFVSSGLGTSILPVRFLVPPEISLITLRSGDTRLQSVTPRHTHDEAHQGEM